MKKILFVCTGNTCRSPMAEVVFNLRVKEKGLDMKASSSGLFADGSPLSCGASQALENFGVSGFQHTSRQLTEEMLCENDYIIGISGRHAKAIIDAFPAFADKVFAFPSDIPDPFGMDTEVYLETLEKIRDGIDIIISELSEK